MKTKEEIIASLPERLRRFDFISPLSDLDDANKMLLYYWGVLQENIELSESHLRDAMATGAKLRDIRIALTKITDSLSEFNPEWPMKPK